MFRIALFALLAGAVSVSTLAVSPSPRAPLGERARTLIDAAARADRVAGLVAAWSEEGREGTFAVGYTTRGGPPVDENTPFEIGSIAKVFVAAILADEVRGGRMELDAPVQSMVPGDWVVPARAGAPMTLRQLATHTSGLPRVPTGYRPADATDPYRGFGPAQLRASLGRTTIEADPGSKASYSNFGYMLLSYLLVERSGAGSFEALAREKVHCPLRLVACQATAGEPAQPHDESLRPVPAWTFAPSMGGVGSLRLNALDLLRFTRAHEVAAAEGPNAHLHLAQAQGLAWQVAKGKSGAAIVWHNGGTGGSRSFIGFDRERKRSLVLLTNTSFDVTSMGLHLLSPEDFSPPFVGRAIGLEASVGAGLAGEYRDEGRSLHVMNAGRQWLARLGDMPPVALHPVAGRKLATADGKLEIEVEADGSLRIADKRESPVTPKAFRKVAARATVAVPEARLQPLAGRYRTASGREFEVTRAGDSIAIATGGATLPLVAYGDTEFGSERFQVAVRFTVQDGQARELTWSQMGSSTRAERVP